MTTSIQAEEKAKELFERFKPYAHSGWDEKNGFNQKELELNTRLICQIHVGEIINLCAFGLSETEFWKDVREELTNIKLNP